MSTVKDIEAAISSLSPQDFSELRDWFTKFEEESWDRQIKEDAKSDRLDALYERLQQEDLEDHRELAAAKAKNAGKPGTSLRDAAKELGV